MTTLRTFQVGDGIQSRTVITTAGALTDPFEVVLKVRDPDGEEVEHAATQLSPGTYEVVWSVTKAGTWHRRWRANDASGNSLGVDEGPISVEPSVFAEP